MASSWTGDEMDYMQEMSEGQRRRDGWRDMLLVIDGSEFPVRKNSVEFLWC